MDNDEIIFVQFELMLWWNISYFGHLMACMRENGKGEMWNVLVVNWLIEYMLAVWCVDEKAWIGAMICDKYSRRGSELFK